MRSFLLRTIDILFSLTGIILSLPILLVVSVTGLLGDGSPLFFQQRVGKNQKIFPLIKFRTMATNTRSVGTHLVDVSAVTKLGKLLRRTKIDELHH